MTVRKLSIFVLAAVLFAFSSASPAQHERDNFRIAWSIYVGWMPWAYADSQGIVDKWADKYDIDIDLIQVNDYVESINQYTAGNVDGVTATNMDALTLPAASGVDTTAIILGDYSNGNDGVVLKGATSLEDIAGRQVNLVQYSVSDYLLSRALDSVGMTQRDISPVNTADADIVGAFANPDVTAAVTWNPQLSVISNMPDATRVFSSKQIPREILDLTIVNTDTLNANPDLGKALVGAWYEVMAKMAADDPQALSIMAEAAGTDLAGYRQQLAATHLYTDPAEAAELMADPELLETMQKVARFSFKQGLLGPSAPSPEVIGIRSPAGVYGNNAHIKLRFDPRFTRNVEPAK
ncbi:putative urea ABC transporter substrate-binding protein [uncultured Salinisphaera sp.]|uniref:putative urea ABC transporter substrate-binding protein n=1 Tax=uncultured Salinisphaera sp. TaxID=359372 RepID=UPI0032B20964|tara:strand:- start:6707 stop:7759 length:1053 start_codon:yes stop_codon:yes gene_type:complete